MKFLKQIRHACLFLAFALALGPALLPAQSLEEKVTMHTLKNGLTVLFAERHGAPVFSTLYGFKVGSVDEYPGITGTAHLFEHMAFKGTPRIGTRDYGKEKVLMDEIAKVGHEWSVELAKGDQGDKEKLARLRAELTKLEEEQQTYIV